MFKCRTDGRRFPVVSYSESGPSVWAVRLEYDVNASRGWGDVSTVRAAHWRQQTGAHVVVGVRNIEDISGAIDVHAIYFHFHYLKWNGLMLALRYVNEISYSPTQFPTHLLRAIHLYDDYICKCHALIFALCTFCFPTYKIILIVPATCRSMFIWYLFGFTSHEDNLKQIWYYYMHPSYNVSFTSYR